MVSVDPVRRSASVARQVAGPLTVPYGSNPEFKILISVVVTDAVLVMDRLAFSKLATEAFLHDMAMLKCYLSIDPDPSISLRIKIAVFRDGRSFSTVLIAKSNIDPSLIPDWLVSNEVDTVPLRAKGGSGRGIFAVSDLAFKLCAPVATGAKLVAVDTATVVGPENTPALLTSDIMVRHHDLNSWCQAPECLPHCRGIAMPDFTIYGGRVHMLAPREVGK